MKISKRVRELREHVLGAGHERKVFKEVLGVKEGAELLAALGGGYLPKALAGEVGGGNGFVEGWL